MTSSLIFSADQSEPDLLPMLCYQHRHLNSTEFCVGSQNRHVGLHLKKLWRRTHKSIEIFLLIWFSERALSEYITLVINAFLLCSHLQVLISSSATKHTIPVLHVAYMHSPIYLHTNQIRNSTRDKFRSIC